MAPEANPGDEERLLAYGRELADGIESAVPRWVEASVSRLLVAYRGDADDVTMAAAREAGEAARREAAPRVRALLAQDVGEQRGSPLAIVRSIVCYPTEVLHAAGVPPVVRDPVAQEQFPDDLYDLTPGSFADLDPSLHDIGIRWGAAKAFVYQSLRRR